jgi:hypothetical protein
MQCGPLPEGSVGVAMGETTERSIVVCAQHRTAVMFGAIGHPPAAERRGPPRLGRGRRSQVGPPDDDGA